MSRNAPLGSARAVLTLDLAVVKIGIHACIRLNGEGESQKEMIEKQVRNGELSDPPTLQRHAVCSSEATEPTGQTRHATVPGSGATVCRNNKDNAGMRCFHVDHGTSRERKTAHPRSAHGADSSAVGTVAELARIASGAFDVGLPHRPESEEEGDGRQGAGQDQSANGCWITQRIHVTDERETRRDKRSVT